MTHSAWKWVRRRVAVERLIYHLKADHRMDRNNLQGIAVGRINALLAGCGFNIRKLLRELCLRAFFRCQVSPRGRCGR